MTVVASNYARKENDLYQTEQWATDALLRHYPVAGKKVWEPAAGNHLMADALREHGAQVVTSDIKTYDREHDFMLNFLTDSFAPPIGTEAIITNPPYGKSNRDAVKFAERALASCDGMIALLMTAKFDSGKTRTHLLRDNPRFVAKIVLIDRIQWFPGDSSGTEDHAWFVWVPSVYRAPVPRLIYEGKGQ